LTNLTKQENFRKRRQMIVEKFINFYRRSRGLNQFLKQYFCHRFIIQIRETIKKKKEYKKLKYYGSKLSLIMYCKFIVKIKK
jgi:hypothetical protein